MSIIYFVLFSVCFGFFVWFSFVLVFFFFFFFGAGGGGGGGVLVPKGQF